MRERTCRALIGAASVLAPRMNREDWRREWLAEVESELATASRWARRPRAIARCLGAFVDAAWLRLWFLQQGIWLDARFAARSLRRDPGFTAVAALTLLLAIGANTAVFSIAYNVLWRPLPFRDPERLVLVSRFFPAMQIEVMTPPDVEKVRERKDLFEGAGAHSRGDAPVVIEGEALTASVAAITPDLFPLLGARARIGRLFTPEDGAAGAPAAALLSERAWRQYFGGAASVLGRQIRVSGKIRTVVGVVERRFTYPGGSEIWVPFIRDLAAERLGSFRLVGCVARLRPGVTPDRARREIAGALAQSALGGGNRQIEARVHPLGEHIIGHSRAALGVLYAAVSVMLLIACGNIANLMLARSAARQREIAIRAALGAGQVRIARQFLIESVLLAAAGGALGVAAVYAGLPAIVRMLPESVPRVDEIAVDGRILAYAAAVCIACGCVFGLAPLAGRRAVLAEALKAAGKQIPAGAIRPRLRAALAGVQLTLAVVLLVGAGLLLKSFARLLATDLGFRPEGLVVLATRIPDTYGWKEERRAQFRQALVEKVRSVPGIRDAAAAGSMPLLGETRGGLVSLEGDAPPPPSPENTMVVTGRMTPQENAGLRQASLPVVDVNYFRVMGTPIVAGSGLAQSGDGVVVNQTLAKRFFGGESPLGRRIKIGPANGAGEWKRIVGVAGDIRPEPGREPGAVVYFATTPRSGDGLSWLAARAAGAPARAAREILRAARGLDAQAGFQVFTMDELVSRQVAPQRFRTTLVSVFAGVALALAVVGLYGVMSYLVAQRTYELGVRIAAGARPAQILALVLGHGAKVVAGGTLAGTVLALGVTRYLGSLLHQVSPRDAATFALVPVLLAAVAMAACLVPARRAVRVDPAVVLRSET